MKTIESKVSLLLYGFYLMAAMIYCKSTNKGIDSFLLVPASTLNESSEINTSWNLGETDSQETPTEVTADQEDAQKSTGIQSDEMDSIKAVTSDPGTLLVSLASVLPR